MLIGLILKGELYDDAIDGQSGSPLYDADYCVYGIHRGPNSLTKNEATRITREIYTCLDRIEEITYISEVVFP